jgi:hypothetical protein
VTDSQLLELARAVTASEGRPRPRIGAPYCLVCHEESRHETPVCDGCSPRVVMALSKALIAAHEGPGISR